MCGLFNDFLPHFSNLAKHRLIKDVLCPLCNNPLKDANQLNQTFQVLQQLWKHLYILSTQRMDSSNYKYWLA